MMDTYIAMCDCPEIQGLWEQKEGERCIHKGDGEYTVQFLPSPPHKYLEADYLRDNFLYLPRQEDWQNILFSKHYAPAFPKSGETIQAAHILMHQDFLEFMDSRDIFQPCDAWAGLYMNRAHNKRRTNGEWM